MNKEIIKVLKHIRNFVLTRFVTELATDREFVATWLYSDDISVDTGDIPPGTAVTFTLPVPQDRANTAEKISWKLNEWWVANIEWYRDGVKVFEEADAVDGETPARLVPARDSTAVVITNTSDTVTVRAKIRWHYAFAKRAIYESYITGIFSQATEVIEEVAGVRGEEQ
jgi:hypothetical protein